MFYRLDWISRGGRLGSAWVAIRGIPPDSPLLQVCEDLKELILSRSRNIKHRISLRFASELIYGISKIYEYKVNKLFEDCVYIPNVEIMIDEDDVQNVILEEDENIDNLEAVRRLSTHNSSILGDELMWEGKELSIPLPDITPPRVQLSENDIPEHSNPLDDIVDINKHLPDLMTNPSRNVGKNTFLLNRYHRNLNVTPTDLDRDLFMTRNTKSSNNTECENIDLNNEDDEDDEADDPVTTAIISEPQNENEFNKSSSVDCFEVPDKENSADMPVEFNQCLTSTPNASRQIIGQNVDNIMNNHQSIYIVCPADKPDHRIEDITIYTSYQPFHNLIMEKSALLRSSSKSVQVSPGDLITKFQLSEEWSEKGVMNILEKLWMDKKKTVTLQDIIAAGKMGNMLPGRAGYLAISSLTKLRRYRYVVFVKDKFGNVCDIIRGPAAFEKLRSYT